MRAVQSIYLLLGVLQGGYFALWMPTLLGRGFSLSEVAIVLAIDTALATLCELPGGWMADRIGHRKISIIGFWVLLLAYLFPLFSSSPYALAIGIVLIGVSGAFLSGALDAWAAEVQEKNDSALSSHGFVRRDQLQRAGVILGSLLIPGIATYVFRDSLQWTWVSFVPVALIVLWIASRTSGVSPLKQTEAPAPESGSHPLEALGIPGIASLGFAWICLGISSAAADLCFFPRLKDEFHFNTAFSFGLIQAGMSLSRIVGSELWRRSPVLDRSSTPSFSLICSGILFFAYAASRGEFTAISVWLLRIMAMSAYFSTSTAMILRDPRLKQMRATVLSANAVLCALGQLLLNSVMAEIGLSTMSLAGVAGMAAILSGVSFYWWAQTRVMSPIHGYEI